MHAAVRPWVTTGVVLVSAGAIAATPLPSGAMDPVPEVRTAAVQLTEFTIPEIFTLPIIRQYIVNRIDDILTLGVGFAAAGVALVEVITRLPETIVTVTQQIFSGDFLEALTTIETAIIGSIAAVGLPILGAIIERRERYLAVQGALQEAVPAALIGLGTGIFGGVDSVLRSFIVGGQTVADALLPIDLGNLAQALVDAAGIVVDGFVTGGELVVDGIVFAQQTIAAALATPAPVEVAELRLAPAPSEEVTSVPNLVTEGEAATTVELSTTDPDATAAEDDTEDKSTVRSARTTRSTATTDRDDSEPNASKTEESDTETKSQSQSQSQSNKRSSKADNDAREPAARAADATTDDAGAQD